MERVSTRARRRRQGDLARLPLRAGEVMIRCGGRRQTSYLRRRTAIAHSTGTPDDRAESALLVLKRLTAALNTCRLYGARHPRTAGAVAGLAALVTRAMGSDGELVVEVTREAWRLAADDTEHMTGQITPLLHALYGHGVRALSFAPGTTDAELAELLAVLVLPIEKVRAAGGPAEVLRSRDVPHLAVREVGRAAGPAGRSDSRPWDGRNGREDARPAAETPAVAPHVAAAILKRFVAAARNVRLYGEQHRMVNAAIDDLFGLLDYALRKAGSVCYQVRSGSVFAAQVPLEDDGLVAGAFASDCAARRIDRLTFARGLTRAELAQAVSLFARDPEALIVEGGFPEALRARQVAHVG